LWKVDDVLIQSSIFVLVTSLCFSAFVGSLQAQPSSSTGAPCLKSGTTTQEGTQDGQKVTCVVDFCEFCREAADVNNLNCSKRKIEYENARDCKAAGRRVPVKQDLKSIIMRPKKFNR
jgi:hypothetical protein